MSQFHALDQSADHSIGTDTRNADADGARHKHGSGVYRVTRTANERHAFTFHRVWLSFWTNL
jgi:hypothetical protein